MPKYKAVIFDMDGTVLNTLEDIADCVNAVLTRFSLPEKSLEEVRQAVGNGVRHLMRCVIPGGESHPRYQEILAYYVPYYQAHCQNKTRAYDGIETAMKQLKAAGYRMAIVSNKGDGAVKELNRLYFAQLVDEAIGEREGIRRKPAPDSVLEAVRLLGCSVDEAVYVGDSEVDLDTAANAQMPVIGVSWGFRGHAFLEQLHPDYLIDTPEELPALMDRLNRTEPVREKESGRQ